MNEFLLKLKSFYDKVDRQSSELSQKHKTRLKCKVGCFSCCVDNITVFEVEAEFIKQNCLEILINETPYPKGLCAFLNNEGECRIYPYRPYVCRTQGLPLRWLEETNEGKIVEMRDICPQNDEGESITNLKIEDFWTIGVFEEMLAQIQIDYEKSLNNEVKLNRLRLRDLFK
jgi:Fe-S-cluster containining protein